MGDTYNGSRITFHNYNSSIETAKDQSTIFQGDNDVNMSSRSTRAGSRQRRRLASEDTPTSPAVEEDTPTYADRINSKSDRIRPPREKFQELVENAATYQLHSSLDPQDPKPSPSADHYISLSDCTPRVGHVYRIWKEDDIVMHLSTVVFVLAKGRSWQVCKITLCSKNDRAAATFYEEHSMISEEGATDTKTELTTRNRASSRLEPVKMVIHEKQGLKPDAWVNLEESFHMGQPDYYQVVYCGKLTSESREYAVKKHKELYTS